MLLSLWVDIESVVIFIVVIVIVIDIVIVAIIVIVIVIVIEIVSFVIVIGLLLIFIVDQTMPRAFVSDKVSCALLQSHTADTTLYNLAN